MKKILIHFLLLFAMYNSYSQPVITGYGFFHAGASLPAEPFKTAYNNKMGGVGIGFDFGYLANPLALGRYKQYSPVLIGFDLTWTYLGRDKYEYNNQPFLKTEFWTGNYGLLVRLDPVSTGRFRPFADGFAGWGRYWANTKEDKTFGQSILDDNQYLVGKYHDDNFTTGLGAGFIIKAKQRDQPSFTLRLMYYFNGEFTVVQRNTINVSGNTLSYGIRDVNANMFRIQLGVSIFE